VIDAQVNEVEILQVSGQETGVRVVLRGFVPDSCTALESPSVDRDGRLFSVSVTAKRTLISGCQSDPVTFERILSLPVTGQDFQSGGRFGVLANGVLKTFDLPSTMGNDIPISGTEPDASETPVGQTIPRQPEENVDSSGETPATVDLISVPVEGVVIEPIALGPAIGQGESGEVICTNVVGFFEDVTVLPGSAFNQQEKFTKTWRVRNEGSCSWGTGYQLVLVDGDRIDGPDAIPLPAAAPMEVVDISIQLTAPALPGSYLSQWGFMTPDGRAFGTGSPSTYPLMLKFGVRQPPLVGVGCEAGFDHEVEVRILQGINAERGLRGLPPHQLNEALSAVARTHTIERACLGKHSHYSADGSLYPKRVQAAGIAYQWVNETIFNGSSGPDSAVHWWVYESQLHHDILMATKYDSVGIGYVKSNRGPYKEYFTVIFLKP
jgi:uncharacterized protein YkwD